MPIRAAENLIDKNLSIEESGLADFRLAGGQEPGILRKMAAISVYDPKCTLVSGRVSHFTVLPPRAIGSWSFPKRITKPGLCDQVASEVVRNHI